MEDKGWNPIKVEDFERERDSRVAGLRLGSAEAQALLAVTWEEIFDDIDTARMRDQRWGGIYIHRNMVRVTHAANVAGVKSHELAAASADQGNRHVGGWLERKEVRLALQKCLVRTDDPETKDRIRTAIHVFADEPEDEDEATA